MAEIAGFERLVIVTLHRGHQYPSVEMVREEVEGDLVNLMQGGLAQGKVCVCVWVFVCVCVSEVLAASLEVPS